MANLLILAASTGKNLDLARQIADLAVQQNHEVDIMDLCEIDLPMYTPENEKELGDLSQINQCMERILSSQGLIVCAPEYNGSVPPVLNNLIAWVSVQSTDFRKLFNKRTVGLATVSGGGGHHVVMSMRMQFSYFGLNVLGCLIVVNKTKTLNQSSIIVMLEGVLK
jgi:NAD(P)H-dependent FMN reductase